MKLIELLQENTQWEVDPPREWFEEVSPSEYENAEGIPRAYGFAIETPNVDAAKRVLAGVFGTGSDVNWTIEDNAIFIWAIEGEGGGPQDYNNEEAHDIEDQINNAFRKNRVPGEARFVRSVELWYEEDAR